MYKLLAIANLSIITNQAFAQAGADSTSVIIGFNTSGALSQQPSPGSSTRQWTQADTYLMPATTTNNYNTYNTYNTTTGGTCTTTTTAVTGYTNPTQNWANIYGGCAGPYSAPPKGSIFMGGPDACAASAWVIPVWQSVCK